MDYESIVKIVSESLSEKRFKHSEGVADTAVKLARQYGWDENEARLAGILHDITKELGPDEQKALMEKYSITLDEDEKDAPKLWHAITAPPYISERFGVSEDVARSVRYHTTGRAGMSLPEKIIYLADYVEPMRDFDGVEKLRKLTFSDIDEAMKLALRMSAEEVRRNGKKVHHNTLEAIEFMK
ncbi:MAG: bis(5'-nucleosyl)-tetraphosphatase (symmetrical) YqeK [Clostridia bacterium]|jgi:nicotinate-nucleotide adenylyltransferase|nr:bis(5'-nucleosyl)-tetraphosphatase (symmetrical) YqeK [Clostridia bacterium]MBQ1375810.1 bis(5'-nucleosyl)-tetraphosphatase (symmetrical) YqeK [Clostridia bacterium]MBQ1434538.1 bis(5'-nucleosyl)-tetraphosphatase (symmetrical) YqeK [Clostridia bacterium]MBQ4249342.1 bis(5'-nucleosyl)-tetraphosphatase (symmetrical) YqeK [Clostridia bacterium]